MLYAVVVVAGVCVCVMAVCGSRVGADAADAIVRVCEMTNVIVLMCGPNLLCASRSGDCVTVSRAATVSDSETCIPVTAATTASTARTRASTRFPFCLPSKTDA